MTCLRLLVPASIATIATILVALARGKVFSRLFKTLHVREVYEIVSHLEIDTPLEIATEIQSKMLCHPVDNGSTTGELYHKFLPTIEVPDGNIPVVQQLISKSTWRDAGHWPKNLAIYDFFTWIAKYHIQSPKRLVAFSDDPENFLVTPEQRMNFFYEPSTGENNIHSIEALKSIRDFRPTMALLGNVFPMLHDPQLVMSNVFDILEDGGHVFLCAPLMGVSDNMPFHFYHSTWVGLTMLMERAGFETLEMRRWGSYHYEVQIAKLNSQPKSKDLRELRAHPGHEDFVWGLFQKSAAKYQKSCSGEAQPRWLKHKPFTAKDIVRLWGVVQPSINRRPNMTSELYEETLGKTGFFHSNWDMGRAVAMLHYKEILRKYASDIKSEPQELLFGGAEHEQKLGPNPVRAVNFGPYQPPNGDLHKLSLESIASKLAAGTSGVDFCILGQTLEHLYDPFLAVQNLFDVTAPCGFLFTSTPFANIPHMTPSHYYHYSSMGLAMLFSRAGFEVLESGQWGTFEYLELLFRGMGGWPGFSSLRKMEGDAVAQVWGFFRRPCSA